MPQADELTPAMQQVVNNMVDEKQQQLELVIAKLDHVVNTLSPSHASRRYFEEALAAAQQGLCELVLPYPDAGVRQRWAYSEASEQLKRDIAVGLKQDP